MTAMDSTLFSPLAQRAKEITTRELALYAERTKGSQRANERARKSLPLGVPSSFQAYDPYPIVIASASSSWMKDVDDNRYTDFDMGFGALFAGHVHPLVRRAIDKQLDIGTLFVSPCQDNAEVAEMLADRYGLPLWRFTNSGTEATMDAIRVARAVTGRDKIVKVEGGYHGHHDEVMISMKPPIAVAGPARKPFSVPSSAGITADTVKSTLVVPYNDPEALEDILRAGDVACFIVEPVMQNIGICKPLDGYLQAVREITQRYGTLLIFDEVKTGITAGWVVQQAHSESRPILSRSLNQLAAVCLSVHSAANANIWTRSPAAKLFISAHITAIHFAWLLQKQFCAKFARAKPLKQP